MHTHRLSRRSTFAVALLAMFTVPFVAAAVEHAQDAASRAPAATLTPPDSATEAPDADGFLRRWLLLEPISTSGQLTESAVRAAVDGHQVPGPSGVLPGDGDSVTIGETAVTWHAVDTSLYNVNIYHFAYALSRPTSNVLFWITTVVNVPHDMSGVRLAIGSNAASIWWLNGEEVIALFNDRQAVIDDGVSNRLVLKAGPNVIRAAIINAGGATDFCARFLDADDRPMTNLTVSLSHQRPSSGPRSDEQ